jgi:hypothetical protein
MQMVDAFLVADKPSDLQVMPNRNHDFSYDPYHLQRLFAFSLSTFRTGISSAAVVAGFLSQELQSDQKGYRHAHQAFSCDDP